MWKYTRMIVLTALSASLYAAILIPFKVIIPLIPGFTELRPANAIPILCSIFFGPAAAWGAAIGNLIGDTLGGTLGLGSIFGLFGNFLYGYIPYKIFSYKIESTHKALRLIPVCLISSLVCGVVIGWGVDAIGLIPFAALGNIIFLNNLIVSLILCPILIKSLYPRIERWGIMYKDIMDRKDLSTSKFSLLGKIFLWIGGVSGIIIGNLLSIGIYKSALLSYGFSRGVSGEIGLTLGMLPSICLIAIAALLL